MVARVFCIVRRMFCAVPPHMRCASRQWRSGAAKTWTAWQTSGDQLAAKSPASLLRAHQKMLPNIKTADQRLDEPGWNRLHGIAAKPTFRYNLQERKIHR